MNLIEQFEAYVATLIDAKGIYPSPMMAIDDGGRITVAALAVSPDEAYQHFLTTTLDPLIGEAIFGLDRVAKSGQGTEFADVLTCVHFKRAGDDVLELRVRDQFRPGVINYQHEPRIVRPMDWDNEFWNKILRAELFQWLPALVIIRKPGKSNGANET